MQTSITASFLTTKETFSTVFNEVLKISRILEKNGMATNQFNMPGQFEDELVIWLEIKSNDPAFIH